MRQIAEFDSQKQATDFSYYLFANGIDNKVEVDPTARWLVWVIEEDHVSKARLLLEKFKANPNAKDIQNAILNFQQLKKLGSTWKQSPIEHPVAKRTLVPLKWPNLTTTLVLVCIFVSLATGFGKRDPLGLVGALTYSNSGSGAPEILSGQVWRLVSPIFLHFSPWHLIFNMIWLYDLGRAIEFALGKRHLLLLILFMATVSNSCEYLLGNPLFGGMSGVIYALAGFIWITQKLDPFSQLYLTRTGIAILAVWFVLCWTPIIPNVANYAHLGGLLAGIAWGVLRYKLKFRG